MPIAQVTRRCLLLPRRQNTQTLLPVLRRPSHTLLPSIPSSPGQLVLRANSRNFSNGRAKLDDSKKDFKSQLYDSTAQRVAAQRAEEARITAQVKAASGRGSTLAGVFAATFIALGFYYLGTLSSPASPTTSTTPLSQLSPPQHNLSKSNLEASWTDFVNLLGAEHVSTTQSELIRHSTSDWSSHPTSPLDPLPFLILYPGSTSDVSEILKICHRRRLPVTAFSGGTSLEGHFSPTRGGIIIDFQRMNKILKLHEDDLDVIVQPAVGWEELNEYLRPHGLFFPPDPGPGAMIGGMVGTGCSGTNAARYGTMREWVLSLTVVLADGTIIKTRQRPRKSSAGYDLTKLFIGSEGTLGMVTEATLKLAVKPPNESVAVASFPTIREATNTVSHIVRKGIQVAAVELLDDVQIKCINDAGMTTRTYKEAPTLFFKFSGTKEAVKEQITLVKEIIKNTSSNPKQTTFEFAKSDEEAMELWEARKEALWSVVALKKQQPIPESKKKDQAVGGSAGHNDTDELDPVDTEEKVWTTDVAVPVSRLSDIVEATKKEIQQWSSTPNGGIGAIVGHVGDGNFHCILLFPPTARPAVTKIVHNMVHRAIEMEGTVTGEHGVGLVKRDYLEEELGRDTVDAMRRIKVAFDPLCLLNCDKVVRMDHDSTLKK